MIFRNNTLRWGFALALLAALPVAAEDGTTFSFKMRVGAVNGPITKDSNGHRATGLAFELSRPAGKGALVFEFGYDQYNGYNRESTPFGVVPYYTANQNPFNPSQVTQGTYGENTIYLEPRNSMKVESQTWGGYGVRLGYRAELTAGWDWQAGVSADMRETHHEVFMTLMPVYGDPKKPTLIPWADTSGNSKPTAYYEGAEKASNFRKVQPGAYLGVSRSFASNMRFESNLRFTTFDNVKYRSFTETGKAPTYKHTTLGGVVLEVALGIKL